MECSGVTCHSRAPALATAQTNIITASPHSKAHTLSQIPLPTHGPRHQALLESAVPDQIPRKISNGMFLLFFFFYDSLDSGVRASNGKITSRRTERDGREGIFLA